MFLLSLSLSLSLVREKTLVTKDGSLGRSGIWKSLTLSRHDAAISAAMPSFSPMPADQKPAKGLPSQWTNQARWQERGRKEEEEPASQNACVTAKKGAFLPRLLYLALRKVWRQTVDWQQNTHTPHRERRPRKRRRKKCVRGVVAFLLVTLCEIAEASREKCKRLGARSIYGFVP
jgi:hypothetical protein